MTETPAPAPAAPAPVWPDAVLAGALFAIDPAGLGGVIAAGGPGPARDRWTALVRALLAPDAPVRRAPLRIEDDRLLGGLDLAASLAAGRPVAQRGLLAESDGGVVILPMAERMEPAAAARFAQTLDDGEIALERDGLAARLPARIGLIAFDDGVEPEECVPGALLERLAFHLDLAGLSTRDTLEDGPSAAAVALAREAAPRVAPPDVTIVEALCDIAQRMGVDSLRAPRLALRAAAAHAALAGRLAITTEDAGMAARLVLTPRALFAPGEPEPEAEPSPPESPPDPNPEDKDETDSPPPDDDKAPDTEMVIKAIEAALPEDLLARMRIEGPARARPARTRGAGAKAKSARRGRPAGSRAGVRRDGDRLNLVETLRAATPWQKLRGAELGAGRIQVRQSDFRIRRFVQRTESTTIFVVDASGSAAYQRLAEAKGAVELLLAKAYVSRARVALIAFRGAGAEILLPPTRSLTRAKRRLADLPGGGGTPLADGIEGALRLALAERAQERTPLLVFLTDGRANIGRGGAPGRAGAEADALNAARLVLQAGIPAAYIDTAARPRPDGNRFAQAMGAVYAPLPYLDAALVSGLVDGLRATRT
jgi:magnesium chelatase subunit D